MRYVTTIECSNKAGNRTNLVPGRVVQPYFLTLLLWAVTMAGPAWADFTVIPAPTSAYTSGTTLIDFADPDFTVIHSLSDGHLTINYQSLFDSGISERTVPDSWGSWCSPPACETSTPRVGYTQGEAGQTLVFSHPLSTFGLEIEPNLPETEEITATFFQGALPLGIIDLSPDGNAGGLLYAASTTTGFFTSVVINDLNIEDFAFGRQRYTLSPIPEPRYLVMIAASLAALVFLQLWRDSRRKRNVGPLLPGALVVLMVAACAPPLRAQSEPSAIVIDCSDSDEVCQNAITFGQVSFAFSETGSPTQADWPSSPYGVVFVDFNDLTALGFNSGFLQVIAYDDALGTNPRWIVQNLPIVDSSRQGGTSMLFDLGAATVAALAANPNAHMHKKGMVTPAPAHQMPAARPLPHNPFAAVKQAIWNAQGVQYPRMFPPGFPAAALVAPGVTFDPVNPNRQVAKEILTKNLSVEQDVNQCCPGALNDSLQYLSEAFNLTVDKELKTANCPGIGNNNSNATYPNTPCPPTPPNKSRVGQIDIRMNRAQGIGTPLYDVLEGKVKYFTAIKLDPAPTLKHQGVFCPGPGKPCADCRAGTVCKDDDVKDKAGNVLSKSEGALPTINFLEDEILNKKADVEMSVAWLSGNGLAGHCFHVVAYSVENGVPRIDFVQDARQGKPGGITEKDLGKMTVRLLTVSTNNAKFIAVGDFIMGGDMKPVPNAYAVVTTILAEEPKLPAQ